MASATGIDLRAHCPAVVLRDTAEPEIRSSCNGDNVKRAIGKFKSGKSRKQVPQWCTMAAALIGAHVGVAVFFSHNDPYSSQLFPECIWRQVTGWECPGCGGTRALYSLFRGDFVASIAMNPLVVASYAALLLLGAQAIVGATGRRTVRWPHWLAMSLIVTAAAYSGIIRNL